MYLNYDVYLRQKFNFEEIMYSMKGKLKLWKWRNAILGRIQIIKTFLVLMIMYRAGSITLDKKVIKEANSNHI